MIATSTLLAVTLALGQTTSLTHQTTWTGNVTYPARVAATTGGGTYVTDPPLSQVVQLSSTGTLVNTFPMTAGAIGIAVHGDGRVFISRENGSIGVYSSAMAFQSLVNPAPLTLTQVVDLAFDATGNLLFALDSGANRVLVFSESAPGTWTLLRSWGSLGSGMGQFRSPQAIAFDPLYQHVIVADTDNFRVQVFDVNGAFLFKFGYRILFTATSEVAWFARGAGVDVDVCGNIYVADAAMGTVRVFNRLGVELGTTHLPAVTYGTGAGQVRVPCDVTINTDNRMFVASTNNSAIEVYDVDCPGGPAGAGSDGDAELEAGSGSLTSIDGLLDLVRPRILVRPQMPDNPVDIVLAMQSGQYDPTLDLNRDRRVDLVDLQIAIDHFGVGTVADFIRMAEGGTATDPVNPPHLLDMPNRCGRCHSIAGSPEGGLLTAAGQENTCLSCHSTAQIAHKAPISGSQHGLSHPWGVPADDAEPGPAPNSELVLHLDNGDVRCGTCHDPHVGYEGDCQISGVLPTPEPHIGRCVGGPFSGKLCQADDQCDNRYVRAVGDTVELCGQCHQEYDEWLEAAHSHEDGEGWKHYDWSMGATHLCTGPGVPFACCTGDGTGNNCSGNLVCTGPGEPNVCCTGPGTGSCSNRDSCRRCHSGDGYVDFADGKMTSRQRGHFRVADCLTCHTTHEDDDGESLLRVYGDVALPSGQNITGVGSSATCIACHNGRAIPPNPNPPGVTTPHYLNGGAMLEGINAVTTFDAISYTLTSSQHTTMLNSNALSCASCHMSAGPTSGPGVGKVGGHTFNIVDHDSGFENVATSCNSAACHSGLTTINRTANGDYDGDGVVEGIQTETTGLLNVLKNALYAIGASRLLLDPDTGLPTDESNPNAEPANPYWTTKKCVGGDRNGLYCNGTGAGTAPFNCPGVGATCSSSVPSGDIVTVEDAIWNWEYVENSGDLGVKNTGYAIGLLQIAFKGVTNNPVPNAQYRYAPAP